MTRVLFALCTAALCALTATAADVTYPLTGENTKLTFVGKKPDGKHEGGFAKLSGSATVPDGDLTKLSVSIDIETDSLFSDDAKLTAHLKNADFFDVKNKPKASFKSTKIEKTEKGFSVTGDLTLLGKAKSVTFPATIAGGDALTVTAAFDIDRTQWGMNYGKGKISDAVTIGISVTAKK